MRTVATPEQNGSRRLRRTGTARAPLAARSGELPHSSDRAPTFRVLRWWDGVHVAANQDLRRFRRQLRSCRRKSSAESIHQLRVASRRLLVWSDWLLALDRGISPPRARQRLKALLCGLSRMRDCQVHQSLLGLVPLRLHRIAHSINRRLRDQESEGSRQVRRRCRAKAGWFCRDLSRGLERLVSVHSAVRSLVPSTRWIRRLRVVALDRAPRPGWERPESWHRWRVALKRLRFAVESIGVTPGDPFTVRRLKRLLATLGRVQDLDSLARFLRELGVDRALDSPDMTRLLRWVESRRDQRIRRLVPLALLWRRSLASKKPVSSGRGAP